MITNLEIIHIAFGCGLFLLTWELFGLNKYLYTKAESKILRRRWENGPFSRTAAVSLIIQWISIVIGLFICKLILNNL